jgi:predicted Zn-dependent peptidase
MKSFKYILFILMTGALMYCSPKVTDATKSTEKKVKDVARTFRSMAPKAGPAREIKIGDYESFTLDNGLKVIVVENHKLPRISYQLYVDKDYNLEGEYSGLSAIAGDLLTKGTSKWTKSEIDEAVDYIGASLNTSSRGGFASSLTKHTDNVLAIFSEVIKNPSFPEPEFDKIKNQTISGLQTEKDDPNAISRNVSNALIYGKEHPYGEITTELTVSNVTWLKSITIPILNRIFPTWSLLVM